MTSIDCKKESYYYLSSKNYKMFHGLEYIICGKYEVLSGESQNKDIESVSRNTLKL